MGSEQASGLGTRARGYVRAVAPRNTFRWLLAASLLATIGIGGCGAVAGSAGHLPKTSENALLALVAHARTDVASRNGRAAHAALADFVSRVQRLRAAGELNAGTASGLDRQARATAAHIDAQLRAWAAGRSDRKPVASTVQTLDIPGPDSRKPPAPGNGGHGPSGPPGPAHPPGHVDPDHPSPGRPVPDHPHPDHPTPDHGPHGPNDHHPDGGGPGDWLPTAGGPGTSYPAGAGND